MRNGTPVFSVNATNTTAELGGRAFLIVWFRRDEIKQEMATWR